MEISDVAINTGFGLILARGMGDVVLADALARYGTQAFGAGWHGGSYFYANAPRTLHATALHALAEAIQPGGEDFARLFNDPPQPDAGNKPYVTSVVSESGIVGVSQARYDEAEHVLRIALRQVGDPVALRDSVSVQATVTVNNIEGEFRIEGVAKAGTQHTRLPNGDMEFTVTIPPGGESHLRLSV
jgi:hypothetical protein